MRVVHLIDAAGPQASAATLALLAASVGRLRQVEQHVLLLGGASLADQAQAACLSDIVRHNVPAGRAYLGWSSVARAMRRIGSVDLIHCWSIGALSLAAMRYRTTPRLLTVTVSPPRPAVHWLTMLQRSAAGPTVILPISNTIRQAILSGGLPESTVHVLRPGLDMARVDHTRRATLRKSWGVTDDDTKLVALLSDPPGAADAIAATMAVSLTADGNTQADGDVRLLLHGDQRHRRRAQQFLQHVGHSERHVIEPQISCPWQVLPGCDFALAIGPEAGGLSLLWAMVANVPIVAEARYAVSEIVEDRHSAMLALPDKPAALAHRVTQLVNDPQLAWRLRDTARHEAYSYFSRQRYCQNLAAVYDQVLTGRTTEVPPLEVTGGLRFAAR